MEQLWQLFPIVLTEHDESWAGQYAREVEIIRRLLPPDVEYHHIGSTAIAGIWAKPTVDILIVVKTPEKQRAAADTLRRNGYTVMSETETRISLNKGYTENGYAPEVFHLHIRLENDIDEIYFRDYLNAHGDVAKEYERLKLRLWKLYEHDRDGYTDGKTEFVKKYTEIAKRRI